MLTPQQLADAPNNMVRLYQQLEDDIIADIAEKIAAQDYFTVASDWQVQKLIAMNNSYQDILKKLSAATGKTQAEIRRLMEEAASESLKYDDAIYNAAGVNLASLNQSQALLNTLNAGIRKTEQVFENLCMTTAIQTSRQLVRELDAAYMKVTSGAFSPDAAIDSACRSLAKDGMTAFYYESGRRISLEAAVRLNIRTGVAQTCAKIQEQRLQEAGCELVQTTAHLGARPSHVPWQGKVFMMHGSSAEYGNLEEETGYGTVTGLCGANCRHNFFPFYEGISVNQYTPENLAELAAKKVRYNGEEIGLYDATQKQRALERKVREAKRYKEATKAAGVSTAKANAYLQKANADLANFTAQTGLKRQYGREKIFPLVHRSKSDDEQTWLLRNPLPPGYKDERKNIGEYISQKELSVFMEKAKGYGIKVGFAGNENGNFNLYRGDVSVLLKMLDHINESKSGWRLKTKYPEIILMYDNVLDKDGRIDVGAFAATKGRTITLNKYLFDDSVYMKKEYAEALEQKLFAKGTTYLNAYDHELGHIIDANNKSIYRRVIAQIEKEAYNQGVTMEKLLANELSAYSFAIQQKGGKFNELIPELNSMLNGTDSEFAEKILKGARMINEV